jgi:mannitol/fructose-specific phosphotransferase system IIA component (Ntr-type)
MLFAMNNANVLMLSELLSPGTVILNLRGADRDSVLEELVRQVPQLRNAPDEQQTLLKALREREQLHSTGIGDGVALPHARNALVGLVDQSVIVFGRHPAGINFGAIDRMPARLFFLLVAPNVTQHLAILARISRLLRDVKLRQTLLNATTVAQVLNGIRDLEERMWGKPAAPIKAP